LETTSVKAEVNLRVLNDYLIIKPDLYEPSDESPEINRIIKEGTLIVPEQNSIMKRSPFATVVSAGPRCEYSFKSGQRVLIDRWFDEKDTSYFTWRGDRYRFIAEHYILAVEEK
jgi:hypothetical protein